LDTARHRLSGGGGPLFSNLAEKLQSALAKLKGRGKLSEQDVEQAPAGSAAGAA